jgi:hypothetical protein
MRRARELGRRLDALEGKPADDRGPRVQLVMPDDGSGATGYDGAGVETAEVSAHRRVGNLEIHVYTEIGRCLFVDDDGAPCGEDHRA